MPIIIIMDQDLISFTHNAKCIGTMLVKVSFSAIYVYPFESFPIDSFEANLANNTMWQCIWKGFCLAYIHNNLIIIYRFFWLLGANPLYESMMPCQKYEHIRLYWTEIFKIHIFLRTTKLFILSYTTLLSSWRKGGWDQSWRLPVISHVKQTTK